MRVGWALLGITVLLYIVTASVDASVALISIQNSFSIFKSIVPILLVVLLLMAFLNTFVNSKSIAKHIAKDSGIKGWVIAIVAGVISHGSSTIWYPILSDLLKNGAKKGLIVAFFYARAIKLPWLPVMVSYFGFTFTLLLSFYILLAAYLQGVIADKIAD